MLTILSMAHYQLLEITLNRNINRGCMKFTNTQNLYFLTFLFCLLSCTPTVTISNQLTPTSEYKPTQITADTQFTSSTITPTLTSAIIPTIKTEDTESYYSMQLAYLENIQSNNQSLSKIWVYDIQNNIDTEIYNSPQNTQVNSIRWSYTEKGVIYFIEMENINSENPLWTLKKLTLNDKKVIQVTTETHEGVIFIDSLSKDEAWMSAIDPLSSKYNIINLKTGEVKTTNISTIDGQLNWSPTNDNQYIFYTPPQNVQEVKSLKIYDLIYSNVVQEISFQLSARLQEENWSVPVEFHWCPQGNDLFVYAFDELYHVNLLDHQWELLELNTTLFINGLICSPDNNRLLINEKISDFYALNSIEKEAPILDIGSFFQDEHRFVAWFNKPNQAIFRTKTNLWVIDLSLKTSEELVNLSDLNIDTNYWVDMSLYVGE